jgi:hypothetical protein
MSLSRLTPTVLAALCAFGLPLTAADSHAGHDHGPTGHDSHGMASPVGTVVIGNLSVVVSAAGELVAGKAPHVELMVTPAEPAPKALRLWVGGENGRGSVKAKADASKTTKGLYQAHVEVPKPLSADSAIWISVEGADGQTTKGSLELPKAEHVHTEGDGHQH